MRTRLVSTLGIFGLTLIMGTALAQPGGGRPGRSTPVPGNTGGRATPGVPPGGPTMTFALPLPTGTRAGPVFATPTGTPFAGGRSTRVPGGLPAATATFIPQGSLEAFGDYLREAYKLPVSAELPASSPEAASLLTTFASQYLGIAPQMVYATQSNTLDSGYEELWPLLEAFPPEVANLLIEMAGTATIGLYQDGVASLFTGTCSADACTTTQGQMQFVLQEGALGGYGTYAQGTVSDATTALALVRQAFPALSSVSLTASTSESNGYSFVGQSTSQARQSVTITAYYVGTFNDGSFTFIYAIVGVGEGYANLIKP